MLALACFWNAQNASSKTALKFQPFPSENHAPKFCLVRVRWCNATAGTFAIAGDSAGVAPITHSSAYAEETQTLYVTVTPNKTAFALAVIDLGSKTLANVPPIQGSNLCGTLRFHFLPLTDTAGDCSGTEQVELEGNPPIDELNGMNWDPDSAQVSRTHCCWSTLGCLCPTVGRNAPASLR
jgi:hypothetical protein